MDLSPGGGLPLGLDIEVYTFFVLTVMDIAVFIFLNFSAQVGFKSDEWK